MPISKANQHVFHRTLYAGLLSTITLYKRDIDQHMGTVTTYTVYQARRARITKTGEPIQNDLLVGHKTVWMLPRVEMERIGITDINPLDRLVETVTRPNQTRWWQPEATTEIELRFVENYVFINCLRVDPPLEAA